ncbi:hypothetical protein QTP88_008316 [Uroleucon formosanum]
MSLQSAADNQPPLPLSAVDRDVFGRRRDRPPLGKGVSGSEGVANGPRIRRRYNDSNMIVSAVTIYTITIINDLAARTRSRVQRKRAGCRVIDDCGAACLNDFWTKIERTMNIGMGENDRERSPQNTRPSSPRHISDGTSSSYDNPSQQSVVNDVIVFFQRLLSQISAGRSQSLRVARRSRPMLVDGRGLAVAGRLPPPGSKRATDLISREPYRFRGARPLRSRGRSEKVVCGAEVVLLR